MAVDRTHNHGDAILVTEINELLKIRCFAKTLRDRFAIGLPGLDLYHRDAAPVTLESRCGCGDLQGFDRGRQS